MVEANIVSYWSCSKFWRTVNTYILADLCRVNFQVVYHMLIFLFWRLLLEVFLLPFYGRLSFRLCITRLTALTNTFLSFLYTINYVKICVYFSISVSVLRDGCICILKDVSQSIPYRKICNSNGIQIHPTRKTSIIKFPIWYWRDIFECKDTPIS
jgi:hypothetical protein